MKRTFLALSILAIVSTLPVAAYYHFLHYGPNGAVIPEKYNLPQLQNSTVNLFRFGFRAGQLSGERQFSFRGEPDSPRDAGLERRNHVGVTRGVRRLVYRRNRR